MTKGSRRAVIGILLVVGLALIAFVGAIATRATAFAQQPVREFSADTLAHDPDGKPLRGKLYRGASMIRGESGDGTFIIYDLAQQISYVVDPGRKRILVQHGLANSGILWIAGVNPCSTSPNVLAAAGVICKNLGPEPVNGRQTVKWQVTQPVGGQTLTTSIWLDPQLQTVIKNETAGQTMELQNLREGPQPANLFEIPAGYQRMELGRR